MSTVKIQNSRLNGELTLPPSKSAAHRALICSFLAGGGTVSPIISSNDMKATVGVINALKNGESTLNCLESGSTMRFMIPVAAALGKEVIFTGEGSLLSRTVGEYLELLPKHGVTVESNGFLPLKISGRLKNGTYEVNGNVSSQYITGLLLALAGIEGDSAIILKTPLQSKPYVDMTVKVMADYGVEVRETDFGYLIHGGQKYAVRDYTVEGDWSHAAFFMSAAAIGGEITLTGVDFNSAQGDKAVADVMQRFGAVVETSENSITCKKGALHGMEIDCSDIPDMVPAIAVTAAFAKGKTIIKGAERLRFKESNRIKSIVENLNKMGVDAQETQSGMIISPEKTVKGAELCGYNDHRIVMAFSVAGIFAQGETVITDAESINKSYPSFFEDFNKLGGKADVIGIRQ